MRNKLNQPNIDNTDPSNYPLGRIKDNTGANNGTQVNEAIYGDIHETVARLIVLAGVTPNGLPDNVENGYQIVEAIGHLPSKNDKRYTLGTDNGSCFLVPLKISKLVDAEVFDFVAAEDKGSETKLKSTIGDTSLKNVTVIGDFKQNDPLKLVYFSSGNALLIRQVSAENVDVVVGEKGYLKKTTQADEDAGTTEASATTPKTNKEVFTKRVIGDQSGSYLATDARNGLMSKEDKAKLNTLGAGANRYGSIDIGDAATGGIGDTFPVTGDIDRAEITAADSAGRTIEVTLTNAMSDTNYTVAQYIQSKGQINRDNDIAALVFKITSDTKFDIYIEETSSVVQDITLHIDVTQR